MTGLDSCNGSSNRENCWCLDKRSSTKIPGNMLARNNLTKNRMSLRRNTNGLQDTCSCNHGFRISESKVVLASLDWGGSSCGDGAHQSRNVRSLSLPNSLQTGNLLRGQSQSCKVGCRETCESLSVESCF